MFLPLHSNCPDLIKAVSFSLLLSHAKGKENKKTEEEEDRTFIQWWLWLACFINCPFIWHPVT